MEISAADWGLYSQMFGAGTGLISGYYGAKAQKNNLKFQADMAETSAKISELQAQKALAQGSDRVAIRTMQAGKMKSAQKAALAANGVVTNEGSAAELQASEDALKEVDVNAIQSQAIDQAWGYRTQALNSRSQAAMARASASGINPLVAGITSLLGSAGRVADYWYKVGGETKIKDPIEKSWLATHNFHYPNNSQYSYGNSLYSGGNTSWATGA